MTVLYQGQPITGFHFYNIRYINDGTRAVSDFPVTVSVSADAVIMWPTTTPPGCLKNVSFPIPNHLSAHLDFINPKERVELFFWSFNDPGTTLTVTGRCPDVEFSVRPWEPGLDFATRIGIRIHYLVFWFGACVLLGSISYGLYRLGALAYAAAKLRFLN